METLGRLAWGFAGILPAVPRMAAGEWPAAELLDSGSQVARILVVFVFVVLAAFATARFFGKRYGVLRGGKYLRILDVVPLGAHRALYLVEVAGAWLLVGVTEKDIRLIARVSEGGGVATQPGVPESFAAKMAALMGEEWPGSGSGTAGRLDDTGEERDIMGQIERLRMIADRTTGATH